MSEMPPYPSDPYGTQPSGHPYQAPQPYPPQPYQSAPYGYQPMPMFVQTPPTSGVATASMVLGIIGVLIGWCTFGLPCFIAIATGHQALKETKNGQKGGHGMAVAGLILGYLMGIPAAIFDIAFLMGGIASR
ncbi:DUF4190 domain-containing protein [Microbispora sp. KK1-11]|uniref:DUF4190 domain-containing protein n=1 Tax=Microbispora sp. KK1-11 TaxID=2053005 RepID=UPI00115AFEC9|nr:DUF4190 domain-containing protein [Microbispora sp. KK1-11]TQS29116.1 DUF4190 domain-containing protein [Microbispora sp. KK1-11]